MAKFTRDLTVQLTPEEREAKARELATTVDDWTKAEGLEKLRAKAAKEAIAAIKKQVLNLTKVVNTGKEERAVPCRRDVDRIRGTYEVVRLDSMEVIQVTAMTAEERKKEGVDQPELFAVGDKKQK